MYHIQTEDSGVNHPHVITHLFADGGRIIASRKTGYSEHLGAKDFQSIVKKLMQDQHKAMFIELRDCVYDDDPSEGHQPSASLASKPGSSTASLPAAAPAPASSLAARIDEQLAAAAQPSAAEAEPARAAFPPPEARPVAAVPRAAPNATASAGAARTAVPMPAPRFVGTPPPMAVPTRNALDADELDRAAEAQLLGSAIGRARADSARRGVGRYQQTVPAKPARPTRPPTPRSIFGGDALRGKSLDEVILSYLADDASETER